MFSRAFSSGVQPVEIARKLSKEMDAHKTASVQRVYVPNEYTVWLCPDDYERFKDYDPRSPRSSAGICSSTPDTTTTTCSPVPS